MPCSSQGSGLYTSMLNVHNSPMRSVITPWDRQENRGSEKLECLSQVTELVYNPGLGTQARLWGTGARFEPRVSPRAGAHLRQLARRRECS